MSTPDQTPPDPIAAALQPLLDEAELLRTDVRAAEDARRLATRINFGMLGLLVVLVLVLIGVGWQNITLTHQVAKTNSTLKDCTVPSGTCYKESQARTGKAISDLIRAEAIVSECARLYPGESGPAYDKKLEVCVYARLAAPAPTATPKAGN